MKPIYLELSAFGPFAGKTVLPLEKVATEGVFLIHGATGAGKTTIFDAISFALFGTASGETRPCDSFRSDFASEDIPTYVILKFTHRGKLYQIERKPAYQRKKQRGEGFTESKSDATLLLPDNQVISGYQNVSDKVQELLGIDFKQFKQISLLAQGEFTKLLTVESKERGEIFRKVFHTDELSRIGKELKERMLKLKRICEDTEQYLIQLYQGIECPELFEQRERLEQFKTSKDINLTENFQELIREALTLDKQEKAKNEGFLKETEEELKEYQVMEAKIKELEAKKEELAGLKGLAAQKEAEEQENEKRKRKLFFAQNAITIVRPKKDAYEIAKREKEELYARIAEKEEQLKQLSTKEETVLLTYHKAQTEKRVQEELLGKLERAKQEQEELYRRELLQQEKIKKEAEYQQEQEKEKLLKQQISEAELEKNNCRILEEELTDIYREGTQLEHEERERKSYLTQLSEQRKRFEDYESIRDNYERMTVLLEEKLEEQKRKDAMLTELTDIFVREQAGMLAEHLRQGQACPVCGSKEHPEPAEHAKTAPTKEELEKEREENTKLHNEISEISREAASEKATMELLMEHLKARQEGQQLFFSLKREDYDKEEVKRREELEEIQRKINLLVDRQAVCIQAKERIHQLNTQIEQYRDELEDKLRQNSRLYADIQTLDNNIKQIMLLVSVTGIEDAKKYLEMLQREYEQRKKEISEAEAAYLAWNNQKQSETAVLSQLLEQKVARTVREEEERQFYLEALKNAGFLKESEYEASILSEEALTQLKDSIANKESELLKYKERCEYLEREIGSVKLRDAGFVNHQLEELTKQKEQLTKRNVILYSRIENNSRIEAKAEGQRKVMTQLQKEFTDVYWLSSAANGELPGMDRLPFEQYVQAFYFEQVIYEANVRLKKMSGGRYLLLRKKEAENRRSVTGLDLEIMDFFTGKARSVKSLSGGESFKAALALALGLSDVIQGYAGGVSVETLFVDEGFGSLDKDSLSQAVELLKTLAQDHRLVGIISHVEDLKECIEHKIQLIKGNSGSSICF